MTKNIFPLLLALILGALVLQPSLARAGETEILRQHYERAMMLHRHGQYQEAIQEFQAAYAVKQLPRLLLNLGQLHRKLGHGREALGYYELYLRVETNPEPTLRAELDRYIQQTRAMIEAAERVKTESEQARRQAAGDRSLSEPTTVAAPARPPGSAAGPVRPLPQGVLAPVPPLRPGPADGGRPVHQRWWLWTVVGLAAAGAIAGVVAGVAAAQAGPPETPLGPVRVFALQAPQ